MEKKSLSLVISGAKTNREYYDRALKVGYSFQEAKEFLKVWKDSKETKQELNLQILNTLKNHDIYIQFENEINFMYGKKLNNEELKSYSLATQVFYRLSNKLIYTDRNTQSFRDSILENKEEVQQTLYLLIQQGLLLAIKDLLSEKFPLERMIEIENRSFIGDTKTEVKKQVLYTKDFSKVGFIDLYIYIARRIMKTFRKWLYKQYAHSTDSIFTGMQEYYHSAENEELQLMKMIYNKCDSLDIENMIVFKELIKGSLTTRQQEIVACICNGTPLNSIGVGGSQLLALKKKLIALYQM